MSYCIIFEFFWHQSYAGGHIYTKMPKSLNAAFFSLSLSICTVSILWKIWLWLLCCTFKCKYMTFAMLTCWVMPGGCAEWAHLRRQCGPGHRAPRRTEGGRCGRQEPHPRGRESMWARGFRIRSPWPAGVGEAAMHALTFCHVSVGDTVVWSWRQEPARRGRGRNAPSPPLDSLPLTIHLLSRALVLRQSVASPLGCDHFSTLSRAPKCEQASKQATVFLTCPPYFVRPLAKRPPIWWCSQLQQPGCSLSRETSG
jgi:hypothetical protein